MNMGLLDQDNFCSLFVAVDNYYLDKLVMTYPTWVNSHREVIRMPHVFVIDSEQISVLDRRWAAIQRAREDAAARYDISLRGTTFEAIPWAMDHGAGISQREEMLTGLIRCAGHLKTPWYLKLDADTYASAKIGFYYDKWFRGDPCYIASPWNYTKPAGTIDIINAWGDTVPELKDLPRVPCRQEIPEGRKSKDVHPRMASWVMFGATKWTQWASGLCTAPRLPFPSQDTYLSYIQARTSKNWVPVKFRNFGWGHEKNINGLRSACQTTMNTLGIPS